MKNMIFTAEENSFIIKAEGKKLRVSYAEHCGDHESSMQFCKENGGGDETVENWRLISKYRGTINKELAALRKELIADRHWTTELSWCYCGCAFVVDTFDGNVFYEYCHTRHFARAMSALK